MQINLIPKTREQEQKQNQINSIIIIISVSILVATAIITAIFYSINFSRKSSIKKEESKINELRSDIEKYKDVEEKINSLVSGTEGIKNIIENRIDLTFALRHLQALLPRETMLGDFSISSSKVSFKLKSNSIGKLTEAIKSLEEYEVPTVNENKDKNPDSKNENKQKIKMFKNIDVSEFIRSSDNKVNTFQCSIIADISEEIWTIKN
ncbi:MAG: hypothetical protein QXG00_06330 [Candidatus Woesearchaeota archaeon]